MAPLPLPDDRVRPLTRIVAGLVIPFLVLAFIILYFAPEQSGQRFAWKINPPLQAMFMGAGYLGGSWLFLQAVLGRRWHTVAAGFPAVTAFTWFMLAVTLLHWEIFDLGHLPFQLWLILYVVTPFLIPALWWFNRSADPHQVEPGDPIVPALPRWVLGVLGLFLLLYAIATFVVPDLAIAIWPWPLSVVTARILSGWMALLGVGGLVIARERRWSGWRVGLQSIGIWHILVLVAAVIRRQDFENGQLFNWYVISVVLVLLGMATLYVWMEQKARSAPEGSGPLAEQLSPE